MTEYEKQARLAAALRTQPKPSSVRKPLVLAGAAVVVAALGGAAFVFWPGDSKLEIRASNRAGVEADLQRMTESVAEADMEAYASGLLTMILDRYPPAQDLDGLGRFALIEPAFEAAHETMDGVTVDEIIAAGRENLDQEAKREAAEVAAKETEEAKLEQAEAEKRAILECLQARVVLNDASVTRGQFSRMLAFSVTNNLPWAISGVRVAHEITSDGRSVPWETDENSISIPGGLEPGETKLLTTSLTMFPDDAPDDLLISARIVDVADAKQRQLVRDVQVIGWSEELSDHTCE